MNNLAEQAVDNGRSLLRQNVFPGEVIELIADKVERKYVYDKVFSITVPFKNDSEKNKLSRKTLLKVQFSFLDFLEAFDRIKPTVVTLFLLGFVTFVMATIKLNQNLYFGIFSMTQALVLYVFFIQKEVWLKHYRVILSGFLLALIIEFIVLGWPDTYLSFMYNSPYFEAALETHEAGGSATIMLNESTPVVYIVIKVSLFCQLLYFVYKRERYLSQRAIFEAVA